MSILQLERFWLTELSMRWHGEHTVPKDASAVLNLRHEVRTKDQDESVFQSVLHVDMAPREGEPEHGLRLSVDAHGVFRIPPDMTKTQPAMLHYNAAVILYGFLRGHLATVTALFPGGRIMLPTVDMQSLIEQARQSTSGSEEAVPPESDTSEAPSEKTTGRKKPEKPPSERRKRNTSANTKPGSATKPSKKSKSR